MGTSGTESCEGCLQTQFKHLLPQLALKLSLIRLRLKQPEQNKRTQNLMSLNQFWAENLIDPPRFLCMAFCFNTA